MAQPEVDFAATDMPFPPDELRRRGLVQFPFVMGGVAVFTNLAGVRPGQLRLTGARIADIYLGRITRWNDPWLVETNEGLALPDLPIRVVSRADGSGTTFTFTRFLSDASAEWRARFGANIEIAWPVGTAAEGSRGVIQRVQEAPGSIGYVEYGQVARAGLSYALVQNRAGLYVRPEPSAFRAAAASVDWDNAPDFYLHLTEASARDAYPIAAITFALFREQGNRARNRRALFIFAHALDRGGAAASQLGYVPLPDRVTARVRDLWRDRLGFTAPERLFD